MSTRAWFWWLVGVAMLAGCWLCARHGNVLGAVMFAVAAARAFYTAGLRVMLARSRRGR